jgi:hypothetical protein
MVFWSAIALAALYVAFEAGWTAGVRWRGGHGTFTEIRLRGKPMVTLLPDEIEMLAEIARRVEARARQLPVVFDDEDPAEAEAMAAEILRRQGKRR